MEGITGEKAATKEPRVFDVPHLAFEVPQHDGRLGVEKTGRQEPALNVSVDE